MFSCRMMLLKMELSRLFANLVLINSDYYVGIKFKVF